MQSQQALDRAYELRRTLSIFNLLVFLLTAIFVISVDYLAVNWIWENKSTFGFGVIAFVSFQFWNLGAFQGAREHSVGLSGGAVSLAYLWSVLQDMGVGLHRAFFYLDVEPEVKEAADPVPLARITDGVRFRNVGFSYEEDLLTVDAISFKAKVGSIVAIVGKSGAGKSTLMNLLLRLYDVDSGNIEIDGNNVRDLSLRDLREQLGIVLQENVLFPSSIVDNIKYASPDASVDRLDEAVYVSCMDEFIPMLPDGLETELGERGAKLSTGQRQRISIARAIVKNPAVLILDEPTASLDLQTEKELLQRLSVWAKDRIVFLITHRLASIQQADQILYLEQGRIVESGTHEELLGIEGGHYRAFASEQTNTNA